jgi:hypothetical protein
VGSRPWVRVLVSYRTDLYVLYVCQFDDMVYAALVLVREDPLSKVVLITSPPWGCLRVCHDTSIAMDKMEVVSTFT